MLISYRLQSCVCTNFLKILQTAYTIDKFAGRGSGVRISKGKDSSLWHYLPRLSPSILRVVHLDYTEEAPAEMAKCKALSGVLCEDPLTSNAYKCILVSREAAIWAFAGNHTGIVLGRCGLSLGQGVSSPKAIVNTIEQGPSTSKIFVELLKNM